MRLLILGIFVNRIWSICPKVAARRAAEAAAAENAAEGASHSTGGSGCPVAQTLRNIIFGNHHPLSHGTSSCPFA